MKTGFIAGAFDVIHPGYISMLDEAKKHCDYLVIGLHVDPTLERPEKLKPVLSAQDRLHILYSLKQVNSVCLYQKEEDLINLLETINPDIRFLGDDYKGKEITGKNLDIPIHYLNRNHGWSTTKFKKLIYDQIKQNTL